MNLIVTTEKSEMASVLFPADLRDEFARYVVKHGCSVQLAGELIMRHAIDNNVLAGLSERIVSKRELMRHNRRMAHQAVVQMAKMSDSEYMKSVRSHRTSVINEEYSSEYGVEGTYK